MCLPDASKEPLAEAAASCTPARKAPLAPPAGKLLWRLHGAAYDFEPFVRSHPGGELAIRLAQGVDDRTATNLFASYHPVGRGRAWETLERFRVGAALPRPPEPSAFRAEIEAMLTEHFGSREPRARGKLSAQNAWLLAGVAAAQLVGWALWARGAYAGLLLVPLFHWLLAVNVSHDATHFAVSRSPSLNAALAYASLPFFYGPVTWYSQHVVMHHTAANEVDADPDLQHFQPMKLHPQDVRFDFPSGEAHSWADYAKYMAVGLHLCLAVPVAAGGACTAAFDAWYHDLFRPTIQLPPGLARLRLYRCLNLLAPLLFLSALAYPYLAFGGGGGACAAGGRGGSGDPACFGFWSKSLFAFAPPILSSLIFAVVTQVSHVQPEAQEAAINQEPDFFKRQARRAPRCAHHRAALRALGPPADTPPFSPARSAPSPAPARQALTSVDYSTGSPFWSFFTGGLNVQSLHHTLPSVNSCHYLSLYPKYKAVCERHGVRLAQRRGLLHAAQTALAHIWTLNRARARNVCARPATRACSPSALSPHAACPARPPARLWRAPTDSKRVLLLKEILAGA